MAKGNRGMAVFSLDNIPPAPRGVPQIEVTFDIDANGIVSVSAKDKATGKEQQIRIQASGGLSDSDIDRMVKEAEAHQADDKKRKEAVEARNHADGLIHSTEKNLTEFGDKIPADQKSQIDADVAALKAVLDSGDAETIKAKTDTLAQSSMKLGEAMYKAQAEAPQGAAGAGAHGAEGSAKAQDGVVDADFEEVDPDKKDK
jgi:molecular chaperone DnaK